MKDTFFFANRFLKEKNKYFFSLDNFLSTLGIFIGVFAILVVSSVMNGFDKDLTGRILSLKPEIIVRAKDYSTIKNFNSIIDTLTSIKEITAISPVCEEEFLVMNKDTFMPVKCMGIDLKEHNQVSQIFDKIVLGSTNDSNGIILSMDLSVSLGVTVGEKISITDIKAKVPTPFGLLPKQKKFKVTAIYTTGMPDFDASTIFMDIKVMQKFLGIGDKINYLQIKTNNRENTEFIRKKIDKIVSGNFIVEDWTQLNENIFRAVKLEKSVMQIILILMVIIASFNMSGFLVKFIEKKKSDIGILMAMGLSQTKLVKIFRLYGIMQGTIGSFVGVVLAFAVLFIQQKYKVIEIPVAGFPMHYLPVSIQIKEFLFIPILTIIISYIATMYPIKRIKSIEIIKILRDYS